MDRPTPTHSQQVAMRRALIVTRWLAGDTIDEISASLQVSLPTVRAAIRANPFAREEHRRRQLLDPITYASTTQQRVLAERRQAIAQAWAAGTPTPQITAQFGISVTTVEAAVRHHPLAAGAVRPRPAQPPRFSTETILDVLRTWLPGTPSPSYTRYRDTARAHGWPSANTVITRFGTWNAALTAAGGTPARRGQTRQRWTDDQLRQLARDYLDATKTPTLRGLSSWLQARGGPSASLLRRRVGPWSALLPEAPAE